MELRQLAYTEAVVRHRHFTRAAEELHVAQSALSHQVRRLEAELGTPLFERTSRSVRPTEAGEAVAKRARRILAEIDGVRGELDELRGLLRGRIAVGALLPAGDLDVSRLLAGFAAAFPGIDVGLREGTAAEMMDFLTADEIDATFSLVHAELPAEIESLVLSEEEVVAAFPPGAAPDKARLTAADLGGRPLATPRSGSAIREVAVEFFAAAGVEMRVALESGDPSLIRSLVSCGFSAAILPASLAGRVGPPIETRPLSPPARLPVALLWRGARQHSPAANAFVEFIRSEAHKAGGAAVAEV